MKVCKTYTEKIEILLFVLKWVKVDHHFIWNKPVSEKRFPLVKSLAFYFILLSINMKVERRLFWKMKWTRGECRQNKQKQGGMCTWSYMLHTCTKMLQRSLCLSSIYLSVCLSIYLSISLSLYWSIYIGSHCLSLVCSGTWHWETHRDLPDSASKVLGLMAWFLKTLMILIKKC